MSAATIINLPDQSTARIPKMNFLTKENGLLSWLLTGDHKRIATLYLISITFFFFIGGWAGISTSLPAAWRFTPWPRAAWIRAGPLPLRSLRITSTPTSFRQGWQF